MQAHIIGRFSSHERAEQSVVELMRDFPGQVSLSTSTPHEHWWQQGHWLESSLAAIGGIAATVSNIVPGFGVLFMGGPLDGIQQGRILGDWLEAYPDSHQEVNSHFVIVTASQDAAASVKRKLSELGAENVHTVKYGQ